MQVLEEDELLDNDNNNFQNISFSSVIPNTITKIPT